MLARRERPADSLDVATRRLTALFRARTRALLATLDPKLSRVVSMIPALFHANFPWPELKGDPPGVLHARATLRWVRLARALDLPPPTGTQRGRALVHALLVTPNAGALDVHVVPAPNLSPYEEQRIAQRARAVESILRRRAAPIHITATGPSAQPYDAGSRTRLLSFGALLVGTLPPGFFAAGPPTADPLAGQPWLTAPTLLAQTLSLLTLEPWSAGEGAELSEVADLARAASVPLWRFADDGLLMAARGALRSREPWLPFAACALAAADPLVRVTASSLAQHLGAKAADLDDPRPEAVLALARRLALALTRSARRLPRSPEAGALRALLPHDLLGGGCPRVLMPALKRAFVAASRRGEPPALVEAWTGPIVEVRLGGGGVMGRGHAPAQAWARALTLLGHAWGSPVVPSSLPATWKKLVPRLLATPTERSLWVEVQPQDCPGPPYDSLNRGPQRLLGMSRALVLVLHPKGRPSAHEVGPLPTVQLVLNETARGTPLGFIPGGTDAQPVEARLTRLARRCRTVGAERTLAVELAGVITLLRHGVASRRRASHFARRPMRCAFDPEAPEFGAAVTHGRDLHVGPNQVECLAWSDDAITAHLLSADHEGRILREAVPLADLEASLAEATRLLRVSPARALSVRVATDVVKETLAPQQAPVPDVTVALRGALPFALEVEVDGERFGGRNRWGWSAAATAVLAHWPPGARGAIRFSEVDVAIDGMPAEGLDRLYARSVARRRLETYIATITHTFSAPSGVPNQ